MPVLIVDKTNISMYAFGDLIISIFSKISTITLPLLILYFLNFRGLLYIDKNLNMLKEIIKKISGVVLFLLIIYFDVLIVYIITSGDNFLNFGFTDRSALALSIPASLAILLLFLFHLMYIIAFLLIAIIIEHLTLKDWLAVILAISISLIDTGIRFIFNWVSLIGILPSDNALLFYLQDSYYGIVRPSYIFSIFYWITLISILCFILFIVKKKTIKDKRG